MGKIARPLYGTTIGMTSMQDQQVLFVELWLSSFSELDIHSLNLSSSFGNCNPRVQSRKIWLSVSPSSRSGIAVLLGGLVHQKNNSRDLPC